jgi:hypothetical protein
MTMTTLRIRALAAAGLAVVGATIALAGPAVAGEAVDPSTLNPVPPPWLNPQCSHDGDWIICHTTFGGDVFSESIDFGLPCGIVYSTGVDVRNGIRWYDGETRTIVKRFVRQDAEFTFSLSPGGGPTVHVAIHATWRNPTIPDPSDVDSSPQIYHGSETWSAPGYGVIVHVAGLSEPDGTHLGLVRTIDDPAVAAELCSALGA